MRLGAASFQILFGDSESSNLMRNCNFNQRRVWSSLKP
jgi:hypothetical protein